MNIKETFLELTKRTYPHGKEHLLFPFLEKWNLSFDEFGNLYKKIGDKTSVMFTSHLDTATSADVEIKHVFEGNIIKTDGQSILGADDKSGVTIMLNMIENKIPGLYYFFLGEEVGCIGSKKLSDKFEKEGLTGLYEGITKCVSFDRRGLDSVITYQGGRRTSSDNFAKSLSKELNKFNNGFKYEPDENGVCTDSLQFVKIIPECTNISVGYYKEHTKDERQDIKHLELLSQAVLEVDWENLPAERDVTETDWKYSGYGGYGAYSGYDWDEWEDWEPPKKENFEILYYYDEDFSYVSSFKINDKTGDYIDVDLDPNRIEYEKKLIERFLRKIELSFKGFSWNGVKLTVFYLDRPDTSATRRELQEFEPELNLEQKVLEVF